MDRREGLAARVVATAGLMLAVLMQTLDSTIANVALPHMMGSLSAAQDQITWVLTSYILAAVVMTPLSGWISLKVGRKPLFLFSISSFMAASVLCGVATSLPEMVGFRILQGIAGAGLLPLSQAAIFDMWEPEEIPTVMAFWNAVVMLGPIMGPTLGGYITEHFSWRWVFYINVPVGALALSSMIFFLGRDAGGKHRPFDFLGFTALAIFMASIQLILDRGPSLDWFGSHEIWVETILAACAVYVFIAHTVTAKHPFFPHGVFRDRNFIACVVLIFVSGIVLYSTNAILPSFMQNLLGYSALQSGETSMFRGVGSLCSLTLSPWMVRRFKARTTVALGLAICVLALWQMAHFDLSMTAKTIKVAAFVQGAGMGLMASPLSVLAYVTILPRERTEAAVLMTMARTLGGSLGIAGLQALFVSKSAAAHEGLAARVTAADPVIRWRLPEIFNGTTGALEAFNAEVTRQGSMMAYDTVFAWMALGLMVMAPLLLTIERKPKAEAIDAESLAERAEI